MKKFIDELKRVNASKNIKIGKNTLPDGYSLYLEYNKDYKRNRRFLKMKVSNSIRMTKEDEETLYKAEIIRDTMELELYGNPLSFMMNNKLSELDFIQYFKEFADKKNLPSYKACTKQIKEFVKQKYHISYIRFSEVNVNFCKRFKEFLSKKIADKKLANQTAKTYLSVFAAALNNAYNDKLLPENPAARVRIKLIEAKREFLTEEELKQFMLVETNFKEIKNAFLFAAQTSLRLGDIRNLRFNDIRRDKKDSNSMYIQQNKNKVISNIRLSKVAYEIYQEQLSKNSEGEFVFNLPKSRSFINDKLRIMAEDAGIKKYIHFHVSRHSWASLALAKGIDIYTVSKIMGHSSVAITEIYANLINKKRDEVADIMNLEITEDDLQRKIEIQEEKKKKNSKKEIKK
jgi:integrase